eukprot:262836-Rhodomonas_salina.1
MSVLGIAHRVRRQIAEFTPSSKLSASWSRTVSLAPYAHASQHSTLHPTHTHTHTALAPYTHCRSTIRTALAPYAHCHSTIRT